MKAIMIMFDTLSRRFLSTYGNDWVKTPNFERLKKHCCQFDNFYSGSLPCMPARRELHTGRYNFLHRSWGPLEPFDESTFEILKSKNVYAHIVTDHNHYWEDGGATYLTRYSSWEGFRGQEGDCWVGLANKDKIKIPSLLPSSRKGNLVERFYANKSRIVEEKDFSSVKTLEAGIQFIQENQGDSSWFLQIECFDPHEPFDVPQRFLDAYDQFEQAFHFDWPIYGPVCESEEEKKQITIRYAALISMCDEYLGKVLDTMDENQMWEDTMLIVNTDHGFLMGEHDWWGKSVQPLYQEVAHLPFFLHIPKIKRKTSQQLAQTIDIAPTILDYFHMEIPKSMLGKSLIPVVREDKQIHDALLYGYFGNHVNITDGRYTYMRAPIHSNNTPLNEYTLMPTRMKGFIEEIDLKKASLTNEFASMKNYNVLKVERKDGINSYIFGNRLYDVQSDYTQIYRLNDIEIEATLLEKMRLLLVENEAPKEQYKRLGLNDSRALSKTEILEQKYDRIQDEMIEIGLDLTKRQEIQIYFIKCMLPSKFYLKLIKKIESYNLVKDLDEIIRIEIEKLCQQIGMNEEYLSRFMLLLEYADKIE